MNREDLPSLCPRLIVFSSLFPSDVAPAAGTFIKERMFRVAKQLPLVIVAPQPWSPVDWFIRLFRGSFRPQAASREIIDGIEVHRPRWFSVPGVLKRFDGRMMAIGSMRCMRRLQREFGATLIDAHFLYPDGWAATRIGRRLGLPVTITIRGSKDEWLIGTDRERYLVEAMTEASRLFAVSEALKRGVAMRLGIDPDKVSVIGNGVDLAKFTPVDKREARRRLGIAADAKVLIGVGGLIPRKGFHRVIRLLPELRNRHPGLVHLIVGGGATQADMRAELQALARAQGVSDVVRFCGIQPPEDLKWFYGAADVFALATEHEGWANVFLEAMACGLPVITTRVGGNAEVVCSNVLGELVDWWDSERFLDALDRALASHWDSKAIIAHARSNTWDDRVKRLVSEFEALATHGTQPAGEHRGPGDRIGSIHRSIRETR